MEGKVVPVVGREVAVLGDRPGPPAIVTAAGKAAAFAYAEFFGAEIESPHTYRAYRSAVDRFLAWCAERGVTLPQVSPVLVGEYIRKQLVGAKPTKKLHLSALRRFFDQLVLRHVVLLNPAASVRAPRYSVVEGKTPALSVEQARQVLAAIDTRHVVGLRDRAIIAILIYTAARVGAVAKLRLQDYSPDGNQWWFHFDEKGGKARTIPARYDLQTYVDVYLAAAKITKDPGEAPLFRSAVRKTKVLTPLAMSANDIYRMVKRRLRDAGLPARNLSCHSFRATTITDLLTQGVPLEDVQYLAGHADPRTTRLYDRRQKQVTRNIVERISV
ncbi:MAG: tyrosine-type recombinase/integrase [Deltaproteobacteria bacterium]|nr:tyrosine-type recombinase/integrase [Deltaproteobacteria bacterium]